MQIYVMQICKYANIYAYMGCKYVGCVGCRSGRWLWVCGRLPDPAVLQPTGPFSGSLAVATGCPGAELISGRPLRHPGDLECLRSEAVCTAVVNNEHNYSADKNTINLRAEGPLQGRNLDNGFFLTQKPTLITLPPGVHPSLRPFLTASM